MKEPQVLQASIAPRVQRSKRSVDALWQWFLAHTGSKPVILIGDSQGAAILIHLISAQLDHQPAVLRRLLVAILVGGNLQVPSGKTVGATFTKVPLCTMATQTGCAIAFSSYASQPPADSVFGRPGQGTSLQSQETAKAGQQVACVNPAAVGGGTADLDPYLLTASQTQTGLKEPVPTRGSPTPGSTRRPASKAAALPGSRSPASPGQATPGPS
jgi:Protein of unknown function (DUF3089)